MNLLDTEIPDEVVRGLELRYPQVNVRDQISLMALWLSKNPSRRPKLVIRFVETWLRKSTPRLKAVPKQVAAWWTSEAGTMEQARLLGMSARPGEDMAQFRKRIADRMREAA